MSIEENKALIYRLYDLYNRHELDATNEFYAPDCIGHFSSRDVTVEQNKQFDIMVHQAFPDFKCVILDMIAEGDKVALIVNVTGTHTGGPFMGIPPAGKKINITNTYILTLIDHKVKEFKGTMEMLLLLQQLGVVQRQ